MELFFVLLILLIATRSFGEVAERFGQPALVGELLAGITLGTFAVTTLVTPVLLKRVYGSIPPG